LFLAFACAVVVVAQPRGVGAYDYVVNGGFESGTDGWSAGPTTQFETLAASNFANGASGSVARITLSGSNFTLRQTSTEGTPAGTYDFFLRIRLESRFTYVYAEVSSSPNFAVYWTADAPAVEGEWIELSGQVQVTGYTNVVFKIGGTGSPGDVVYVDDVRFDGASPATMTPTHTPTATNTPIPPSPTKTPKATNTPKPTGTPKAEPTATAVPEEGGGTQAFASGALINPGFEDVADGVPVAWDKYGGSLSSATSPVRTGGRAARFESTSDSTKWLFQSVTVTGGDAYAFDAWVLHNDPGVASAFLRVSWYESADGSGTALGTADSTVRLDVPSSEWRWLTTGVIPAPPEARSAKARVVLGPVGAGRAAIYVDDAAFGPADPSLVASEPEPAAGTSRSEPSSSSARTGARSSVAGTTAAPAEASSARILISEVLYDATGDAPDADGEFVELYNPGNRPSSLEGWMLADNRSIDVFDAVTIPAHGYVVVVASDSHLIDIDITVPELNLAVVDGRIGNSLGNDGDVVVLLDPAGRFVDAVSWGADRAAMEPPVDDVPAGHSIERLRLDLDTDTAPDFIDNESPSPGGPYEAAADAPSRVRSGNSVEILSGESGLSLDWLPWAVAAVSVSALAGVASWRIVPALADRLRHQ
jgi:hypothetical protein